MSSDRGPVVQQALLINKLTQLRRDREMTQEKVAQALEWSHHKMMRYEGGKQVIPKTALDALLRHYGVEGTPLGDQLTELARGARQSAWWHEYRQKVNREYLRYIGLEAGATSIRQVHTTAIPGLLQTSEYAHVITSKYKPHGDIEKVVNIRMQRQNKLRHRTYPPVETYVLDEAVVRRRVGKSTDPGIMRRQIERLIEIAQHDNPRIHIIPLDSDWHYGLIDPFILLGFEGELGDILYIENRGRCNLIEDQDTIKGHISGFNDLMREYAHDSATSREILRDIYDTMTW